MNVSDSLEVPFPGESLVPTFDGGSTKERELWWYHEGNRAFRLGNWKIVSARDQSWELFNLLGDRTETNNLASDQPDKAEEMEQHWERILAGIREVAPVKIEGPEKVRVTDH